MTDTLANLGTHDPGALFAAAFLLGVMVGMAFLSICLAWDRQQERGDSAGGA